MGFYQPQRTLPGEQWPVVRARLEESARLAEVLCLSSVPDDAEPDARVARATAIARAFYVSLEAYIDLIMLPVPAYSAENTRWVMFEDLEHTGLDPLGDVSTAELEMTELAFRRAELTVVRITRLMLARIEERIR